MNAIRRTLHGSGRTRGQSIYLILLILSAVALALAAFFPLYEFATLYKGAPQYTKPATYTPPTPPAPPKPAEKAPAPGGAAPAVPPSTEAPKTGAMLDGSGDTRVARSTDGVFSTTRSTAK